MSRIWPICTRGGPRGFRFFLKLSFFTFRDDNEETNTSAYSFWEGCQLLRKDMWPMTRRMKNENGPFGAELRHSRMKPNFAHALFVLHDNDSIALVRFGSVRSKRTHEREIPIPCVMERIKFGWEEREKGRKGACAEGKQS